MRSYNEITCSHHSVISTSTPAGGYYHYSLLWFLWFVGTLQQSIALEAVMYEKIRVWLSFPSDTQISPTAATPSQHPHKVLLRSDAPFYITQGSSSRRRWQQKKNSTILEREPGGNNEIPDIQTLPGDEKQVILL